MNEIFAIDPTAPEDSKDISAMFSNFGFANGRFIACYPNDWLNMLLKHSESIQGIDRTRFIRKLDLHRDAILSIDADYKRMKPWIENALETLPLSIRKSKVLATRNNAAGVDSLQQFLWDGDVINSSVGDHIPMSVESYAQAIRPLLKQSTEVHLVDPFFQLRENGNRHKEKNRLLSQFLLEAENSKRCESFLIHFKRELHLSRQIQEKQIAEDLNTLIESLNLSNTQPGFTLRDEMSHGRYIFSIKGGLQFDHGFTISFDKKKTNHVHWLSKPELSPLQNIYGL